MQVHHVFAAGKIALGCFAVLGFAVLAIMGAQLGLTLSSDAFRSPSADSFLPSSSATPAEIVASADAFPSPSANSFLPSSSATPAEIVAARFPLAEAAPEPVTFSTANVIPGERGEPFDLNAVSGMATTEPTWPAADEAAPATTTTEGPEPVAHRPSARSPNVLNEAQIASIKQRLKLTAEQARLWPAVEAALRKIVYTRTALTARTAQSGSSPAIYIDPGSAGVRELRSAALPLIMHLNEEQKREVKMLAYVMGLEAVVSQF